MKTIKLQLITMLIVLLMGIYKLSKLLFNSYNKLLLFLVKSCLKRLNNNIQRVKLNEFVINID